MGGHWERLKLIVVATFDRFRPRGRSAPLGNSAVDISQSGDREKRKDQGSKHAHDYCDPSAKHTVSPVIANPDLIANRAVDLAS